MPTSSRSSAVPSRSAGPSHTGDSTSRRGQQHQPRNAEASNPPPPDVHYTVLIRLPFPRHGFVDPPSVDWNTSKDNALWKILSRTSNGREINWKDLAHDFQVPLPFLFQQVAWLYERQLSQVRAQMRKVGSQAQSTPPPQSAILASRTSGAQTMKRDGSGGIGSRAPSSLAVQSRESPALRGDNSLPATPTRAQAPPMSRTSSASTAVQSRQALSSSSRRPSIYSRPSANNAQFKAVAERSEGVPGESKSPDAPTVQDENSDNSTNTSSDEDVNPKHSRSQLWKRQSRTSSRRVASDSYGTEDDDEDDSPAFLPFSSQPSKPQGQGQSHAISDSPQEGASRPVPRHARHPPLPTQRARSAKHPQPSHSSASSASSQAAFASDTSHGKRPSGPLSPRRTAELLGKSPRRKNGKDASDGTPSMGSSFSDLEDTSVTQSALEEALLSNMQHGGGVASRMSTISQALKSRYLQ
ncbi:MAG: hypothetical protein M1837_000805 [Sclerophora amabilis]|nr:MAG: hypothetical protein M1837_000805 [Sclerophora amabilis]